MTSDSSQEPIVALTARAGPFAPASFVMVFLSGCSAVVLGITWTERLRAMIGMSASSDALMMAVCVAGLGIGALGAARRRLCRRDPIMLLFLIHGALAALTLAMVASWPLMNRAVLWLAQAGGASVITQLIACIVWLGPPMVLLGAVLPTVARWAGGNDRGNFWVCLCLGGAFLGAATGTMVARFSLLPIHSANSVLVWMALLHLAASSLLFILWRLARFRTGWPPSSVPPETSAPWTGLEIGSLVGTVLVTALLGMAITGAHLLWWRVLGLLHGQSVQSAALFNIVFLLGLGVGAAGGALVARGVQCPGMALGSFLILSSAAAGWTVYALNVALPNWPINPFLASAALYQHHLDFTRSCWAVIPATLLWGAALPLAQSVVFHPLRDPGRRTATLLAALAVGAILGILHMSLKSIPDWGLRASHQWLIILGGLAAVGAILPVIYRRSRDKSRPGPILASMFALALAVIVPAGVVGLLARTRVDRETWQLLAFGRRYRALDAVRSNPEMTRPVFPPVFNAQGRQDAVVVTRLASEGFRLHIGGRTVASTLADDMHRQLLLGHLPALFHPSAPQKLRVLVADCGTGITAGSFLLHDTQAVVICQAEPRVIEALTTPVAPLIGGVNRSRADPPFALQNNGLFRRTASGQFIDSRVRVVSDDARHFLAGGGEKFDIIVADAPFLWVDRAAQAFTVERFEVLAASLKPRGIVAQWVPLQEISQDAVRCALATFFEAFPRGSAWCGNGGGAGFGLVLIGSNEPLRLDPDGLESRMGNLLIADALRQLQIHNVTDLLKTYVGQSSDLDYWLVSAHLNRDGALVLPYLAGDAVNDFAGWEIRRDLLEHRQYPVNLLGDAPALRRSIEDGW